MSDWPGAQISKAAPLSERASMTSREYRTLSALTGGLTAPFLARPGTKGKATLNEVGRGTLGGIAGGLAGLGGAVGLRAVTRGRVNIDPNIPQQLGTIAGGIAGTDSGARANIRAGRIKVAKALRTSQIVETPADRGADGVAALGSMIHRQSQERKSVAKFWDEVEVEKALHKAPGGFLRRFIPPAKNPHLATGLSGKDYEAMNRDIRRLGNPLGTKPAPVRRVMRARGEGPWS